MDPRRIPTTNDERVAVKAADLQRRLAKIEKIGAPVAGTNMPQHASSHESGGTDELALAQSQVVNLPTDLAELADELITLNALIATKANLDDPRLLGAPTRHSLIQPITCVAGNTVTVDLALSTAFTAWKISTTKEARVRLYATAAALTADSSRAIGTAPVAGNGLIFEVITTSSLLAVPLMPSQSGASLESTPSANIKTSITNLSSTDDLSLTLVWTPQE